MFISSFNRFFAKHKRITYTLIYGAIIIPFVLLYGDFSGQWHPGSQKSQKIGEIYGKSIDRHHFLQQLEAVKIKFLLDYNRYLGTNNDEIIRALSSEVLNRLRALHVARELGIDYVTDNEIKIKIVSYPIFHGNDGKFDPAKFNNFKSSFLPQQGLSARDFDQIIRENIIVDRVEKRITESITVSETEARAAYLELFTKCETRTSEFPAIKYLSEVKVSEEEVEKYFNDHLAEKYQVPVQTKLQVVTFSVADYQENVVVKDEEVAAYYEQNKTALYSPRQFKLRHILVRTDEVGTVEEKQTKREACESLLNDLKEGKDFAALAEAKSEDKATVNRGGDLSYINADSLATAYSTEFEEVVMALKPGEISGVIATPYGYHLVQKMEERDVIPLDEVEGSIRNTLISQKEEIDARQFYDANKKDKYSQPEVHARHILIRTAPEDTPAIKAEKRQKLESILKEAREKNNFYELALQYSDDTGNSSKGGDLGFFARGQMVKPFEDKAFSIKIGEISDIVETSFGYHIIEKLEERDQQPYDEVKNNLIRQRRQERKDKALKSAKEDAYRFAVSVHAGLQNVPNQNKAREFVALAKNYTQARTAITPMASGYFSQEDFLVPEIPGITGNLAIEGAKLSLNSPLSQVIESGQYYYVACWQSSQDSYTPAFKEPAVDPSAAQETMQLTKQAKKAERDLKNEKAIQRARESCRIASEEIKAQLDLGLEFAEAVGDYVFSPPDSFVLSQGPTSGQNRDLIRKVAQETPDKTLAAPMDTDTGALLVYVLSHTLPTEEDITQAKSFWISQYRRQQQQAALNDYYESEKEKSMTVIESDWQYMFEAPARTNAPPPPKS